MRNDAYYVATSKPRSGVGYYRNLPNEYRQAKRFKLDDELEVNDKFCAKLLPMRSKDVGWDGKSAYVNYRYLRRFLKSQIGKNWDEVYSEIREKFSKKNRVNKISIDTLKDCIVVNPIFKDGKIYDPNNSWTRYVYEYNGLYVENGIIKHTDQKSISRKKKRVIDAERRLKTAEKVTTNGYTFVKRKGLWYLENRMERKVSRPYYGEYREYIDVYFEYFALSTKELKKFSLKNDF